MSSIAMAADSTHGHKHEAKISQQSIKEKRKQHVTSRANSKQAKVSQLTKFSGVTGIYHIMHCSK